MDIDGEDPIDGTAGTEDPISSLAQVQNICCLGASLSGVVNMLVMASNHHGIGFTIVDTDKLKIEAWDNVWNDVPDAALPFEEPHLRDLLNDAKHSGNVRFVCDETAKDEGIIKRAKMVFIAVEVPTKPQGVGAKGSLDLTRWEAAVKFVMTESIAEKIIVEKSTLPIDVIENHTQRILAQNPLGTPFSVFYNPDFLSQGSAVDDVRNPSHIAIGIVAGGNVNVLQELYQKWVQADRINVLHDYKAVVLGKIAINSILAMKYSMLRTMSELSELVHANFVDVQEVIRMDRRVGLHIDSNLGIGGPGLSKDLYYCKYILHHYGLKEDSEVVHKIIKLNGESKYKFIATMIRRMGTIRNKKIAVFGVSYKKNTNDVRNSTAVQICKCLLKEGCDKLAIYDAKARREDIVRSLPWREVYNKRVEIVEEAHRAWEGAHAIVFLVASDEFEELPWEDIHETMEKPPFIFVGCSLNLNFNTIRTLGFNLYISGRPRDNQWV